MNQEIVDIYTNQVNIAAGVYDIILEFGIKSPGAEGETSTTLARVRMSPQHALVLSKVLAKHMVMYQQRVGEINIPPEHLKDLGVE